MRLSEKRQTALYGAISDPVMKMRLEVLSKTRKHLPQLNSQELEHRLHGLELEIWREVKKALNLDNHPHD